LNDTTVRLVERFNFTFLNIYIYFFLIVYVFIYFIVLLSSGWPVSDRKPLLYLYLYFLFSFL